MPQIVAPIFTSGSLRANREATQVEREIAVAQHEKSIQDAFREVSDGLAMSTTLAAQQEAEAALRSPFAAQEALADVRLDEPVNLVTRHKILGGAMSRVVLGEER